MLRILGHLAGPAGLRSCRYSGQVLPARVTWIGDKRINLGELGFSPIKWGSLSEELKMFNKGCGVPSYHVPYNDKSHHFKPSQEYHSLKWKLEHRRLGVTGIHSIHEYNFGGFHLVFTEGMAGLWFPSGGFWATWGRFSSHSCQKLPRIIVQSVLGRELALRNVMFLLSSSQGSPGDGGAAEETWGSVLI